MGNCASEPKTKGDDSSTAPAPEPRKEESLQTEEVIVELRDENKTDDGDVDHSKQPSLGALLKEEEKACDNLAKLELEAEEKPKTAQSLIEETVVSAAVTQEDKKASNIEEKKPELKETEPEKKETIAKVEEHQKEIIEPAEEKEMIAKTEEDQKEIIVKPAKEKKIIEPAEEKKLAGEEKAQI